MCDYFCLYVCLYTVYMQCRLEKGIKSPQAEVAGGCGLSNRWWELNLGPREEHWILLSAEPSLQPLQPLVPLDAENQTQGITELNYQPCS